MDDLNKVIARLRKRANQKRSSGSSAVFFEDPSELNFNQEAFSALEPQDRVAAMQRMLNKDGVLAACYKLIALTLIGTEWSVDPHPEDKNGEQTERVVKHFRAAPHEGGMSLPFSLFLEQCVRAVSDGFSVFKKEFGIFDDNFLGYKKLAWRDPTTVFIELDKDGSFNGFKQVVEEKKIDVYTPPEEAYVYSFDRAHGGFYGKSLLAAGYHNAKMKQITLLLLGDRNLSSAYKDKVVSVKDGYGTPAGELKKIVNSVSAARRRVVIGLPVQYQIETLDDNVKTLFMETLSYLDAQTTLSCLSQFILLGAGSTGATNTGGSRALSRDHSEVFYNNAEGIRKDIASSINRHVFTPIYLYNFPDPKPGTFKLNSLSHSSLGALAKVLIEFTKQGYLTPEDIDTLTKEAFRSLNIERPIGNPETKPVGKPDQPIQPQPNEGEDD